MCIKYVLMYEKKKNKTSFDKITKKTSKFLKVIQKFIQS